MTNAIAAYRIHRAVLSAKSPMAVFCRDGGTWTKKATDKALKDTRFLVGVYDHESDAEWIEEDLREYRNTRPTAASVRTEA